MVNTGKVMFRIQSLNNMGWVDINTWMGWVKKHFNVFNTAYIQVVNTGPKIGKTYVKCEAKSQKDNVQPVLMYYVLT